MYYVNTCYTSNQVDINMLLSAVVCRSGQSEDFFLPQKSIAMPKQPSLTYHMSQIYVYLIDLEVDLYKSITSY